MLIHCDELSGLFTGMNQYKGGKGNDLQTLMDMVDGNKKRVRRSAKDKRAMLKKPRISLLGTIQPKIVKEAFSDYMKNSGFAFRFLFSAPNPIEFHIGKAVPKKCRDAYIELINKCDSIDLQMKDGKPHPLEVSFTPDAKKQFDEFINSYTNRVVRDYYTPEGVVKPIISKMRTYTPRFCLFIQLIKHLTENTDLNIDVDSVQVGIRLIKYFMFHTYKMLNTTGDLENDLYIDRLISFSTRRGETKFTTRELTQSKIFGRELKTRDVENILSEIQKSGKGVWDTNGRSKIFTLLTKQ
jgi:hypothetical protein